MVEYLQKETEIGNADGTETRELSAKCTTDVVANCIFGLDAGSFKQEDAKIRQMGKQLMSFGFGAIVGSIAIELMPFLSSVIKVSFVPKHVERFFAGVMRDAIEYRLSQNDQRPDFMNFLLTLHQKKNLSDVEMAAYAVTFFLDGFETSSIGMAFLLYELARTGAAQDKLRTEIREAKARGALTFDSIAELPYLAQAFYESLRLHPPLPLLSKRCMEKTSLPLTHRERSRWSGIQSYICRYSRCNAIPSTFPNPPHSCRNATIRRMAA